MHCFIPSWRPIALTVVGYLTLTVCSASGQAPVSCVPGQQAHLNFTSGGAFAGSEVYTQPTNLLSSLSSWTIEFWLNLTAAPGYHDAIAQYAGTSGPSWTQRTVAIGSYQGYTSVILNAVPGGVPQEFVHVGTNHMAETDWHHIAVSWDGSTVLVYLDGSLDLPNTSMSQIVPINQLFQMNEPLHFGGSPFGGMVSGGIDEIRIWNVVRSWQEIRDQRFVGIPGNTPNLVGYWRFDEGSGTTTANAATSTGAPLDGTLASVGSGVAPAWITAPSLQVQLANYCGSCGTSGTDNRPAATLLVNGIGLSGTPPYVIPAPAGSTLALSWSGPPGAPILLAASSAICLGGLVINVPNAGSIDIGTPPNYTDIALLLNGPGTPYIQFGTGPAGTTTIYAALPPSVPAGLLVNLQGAVIQPSGIPFLTSAFQIVVP